MILEKWLPDAVLEYLTTINLFLDRTSRYQAIHYDIFLLANPVDAIEGLVIVRRVPIRVQNDSPICAHKVETYARDLVCKEEAKDRGIVVEFFAQFVSIGDQHVSIKSEKAVGLRDQFGYDVKENLSLWKNEDLVSCIM